MGLIVRNRIARPSFATLTLPGGTTSFAYDVSIQTIGGYAPHAYAVVAGALPTGLSLSTVGSTTGRINGTIGAAAGTYNFTIRATDAGGQQETRAYSIVVAANTGTGQHDFYNALILRSDLYRHWSHRSQADLDATMQNDVITIVASSAATPTVVTACWNGTNVVSSVDGLVTCASAHGIPSTPDYTMFITGHSLSAVNGLHEVVRLNTTQFQILDAISGSGSGGRSFRADHRVHDGALVVLSGHAAIPNGTYVASRLNQHQLALYQQNGTPVTSAGAGEGGTLQAKAWEYFPDTGRNDPAPLPQDAAKGSIPQHQGADLKRQIRCTFADIIDEDFLIIYDAWWADTFRQPVSGPKVPSKVFRADGQNVLQHWMIYAGREQGIASTSAGTATTVTLQREHYYATGDSVDIVGNNRISDGRYVVTVTGAKTFTVPASTASNGAGGTATHALEVARLNSTITQVGAGLLWLSGLVEVSDNRTYPTGPNGAPMGSGYFGSLPVYYHRWTRHWMYVRQNVTGDDAEFAGWNSTIIEPLFGSGRKIGKWNISAVVDGAGVATITCTDGPHGYTVGKRVTIAGIAGVSGTYIIATIPATPDATSSANGGFTGPTTFTVTGATPGASGDGTAALHLNMMTFVVADEINAPRYLYDHIPAPWFAAGYNLFRHEYDSSNDEDPMIQPVHCYSRNTVILLNPADVVLTNASLFAKPIGSGG